MVTKIARAANMFLYSHYTDLSNCLGPRLIQMETHRTRGRPGLHLSGGGSRGGGGSGEGNAGGSELSVGYTWVIRGLSAGYQWVIRGLSVSYQWVISG